MIVVLLNVYLVILFVLVKLKIVPFNLFWKVSPVIVLLLLLFGLFIPMGWGAPQGAGAGGAQFGGDRAGCRRRSDRGAGRGQQAAQGRRRAVPHRSGALPGAGRCARGAAQVAGAAAVADDAVAEHAAPAAPSTSSSARPRSISSRRSSTARKWNLDKTVVRAPADGYVTNLALRKGARVANLPLAPVMAFIDTSDTIIGVEIPQIDARYVEPGQPVELTFKFMPGAVYHRQGRERAAGDRDRAGADVGPRGRRRRRSRRRRSSCASGSTMRRSPVACRPAAPATAAIFTEHVKAGACHPPGAAAADRDH